MPLPIFFIFLCTDKNFHTAYLLNAVRRPYLQFQSSNPAYSQQLLCCSRSAWLGPCYIADELHLTANFWHFLMSTISHVISIHVCRTRLSTVGQPAFPFTPARTLNSLPQQVTVAPLFSLSFPWLQSVHTVTRFVTSVLCSLHCNAFPVVQLEV